MFSLGRSGDVLESYLQSLAKLKENVLVRCFNFIYFQTLFRNYHDLIEAKLDCDSGKLLSYNTQPFCNSLSDALNNIDELEAQLHVLESWFEMPSIQHSFYPDELDRVSEDAQCLIEIVQQFQAALRSVVSKQSLDSGLDSVCPQQLDSAPSNTPMAVDQQRPQQIPRDGALSEFAVSAECQNSASLGTPPKQIKQRQRIQDQGMQQQTAAVAGHVSCDRPFGQDIPDLGNLGQDMTASDSVLPPSQMQSSGMPPFTTMAPATATVVGYGHGLQPQSRIPASLRSALEMASCAADPALPYPQTPSSHSSFGATTVGSEPLPSDSMNVDLPAEKTHGMHLQQQLRHPHPSDYQFHPNMPGEYT
uniref:Uncharacterized protein n=1 Tax=Schistocephalus solidus TaxID=70667 RepID=A0A0X3NU52_SCHSO